MANSKLAELADEKHEMQMTPMIDVTFLLLIFFICTIKFKTLEGKLSAYLPGDVGVHPIVSPLVEKTELLIRVREEGTKLDPKSASKLESRDPNRVQPWSGEAGTRFVYGDDRVLSYQIGPHSTTGLDELEQRLSTLFGHAAQGGVEAPALTIDPREGTVYEDVVTALDRAISARFTDITFAGSYED
jgi:biopolymer transport protein ExbD